jgi:two-component system NtrC family sensor kinase
VSRPRALPRVRLWMKLAALAAAGVVAMHAAHVALGTRIAKRGLLDEEEALGRNVAHLIAQQAADLLLVGDLVTLHELVSSAVPEFPAGVAYCFVVRDGRVLASSFRDGTPPSLVQLRAPDDRGPVLVRSEGTRTLDIVEPILGGALGDLRLGLDMRPADARRRQIASNLGLLAVGFIVVGAAAALFTARSIAHPLAEILDAADRFDPAADADLREVSPRGAREIAILGDRFNRMMHRLRAAYSEQARARRKAVETERMVALGSLVAGVAHEVNNPLAGLKNCVRRLERPELPEPKRREYLSLMGEGLTRIEELVRRLLDYGRPHPPSLAPVPATRLAEDAAAFVRPVLERRRIGARVLDDGSGAGALADRRMVGQALVNLLLNAGYVTPDGGEVRLRVLRQPGLVGIAVEDDGPGIPREIRERVLDPFFSTKPEGEGTGLGLTVSRTIADAHGGELTFEFPGTGGTVATLWLREAPPPAASAAAVASERR